MQWKVLFSVLAVLVCAQAKNGFGPGDQDWGYVTVREKAHMFWWLQQTVADVASPTDRPLLIWLQGGPGASSTGYGNFEIIGPLDLELQPRAHAWINTFNVLLIDNPVGTGYSYVENDSLYATSNQQVATDFVALLKGFYDVHPEYSSVPVYIFGQSYGGKMAIEIALHVFDEQVTGNLKSNISGVAMGNSWLHPIDSTLSWGPFLYQVGLVDKAGLDAINTQAERAKIAFDTGNYYQATAEWGYTEDVVVNKTDGVDFYNILTKITSNWFSVGRSIEDKTFDRHTYSKYYSKEAWKLDELMNGPVKKNLSISSEVEWGSQSYLVFIAMYGDFMKPVTHIIEEVLNRTTIPVNVYNGNLDLICNTPGQKVWEQKLRFTREAEYRSASRNSIRVNNTLEGYKRTGGNFGFYWVNVAGHSVIVVIIVTAVSVLNTIFKPIC